MLNDFSYKPFSFALLFCICTFNTPAQLQFAYNKGFEFTGAGDCVWAFSEGDSCHKEYTNTYHRSGKYSLLVSGGDDMSGYFYITPQPSLLQGKKELTIQAWIKVASPNTHASIWFNQIIRNDAFYLEAFADTVGRNTGWQHIELIAPLRDSASAIYIGGRMSGGGKAWFDDVTLSVDGNEVADIAKQAVEPATNEVSWLNKHAIPLLSVTPTESNADLDSLGTWIADKKVIGVGEPTHGTSEAGLMKFRLFKYLVENKGFSTFMLEDELPECGQINNYVLGGTDTALSLIKKYLFGVCRTEEMLKLIEWMRNYNLSHTSKIQFRGMDMQSIRVAVPEIKRLAPVFDSRVDSMASVFVELFAALTQSKDDQKKSEIKLHGKNLASELKISLVDKKDVLSKKIQTDTVNWFLQNVTILHQYFSESYRDSCLAKNILDYTVMYPREKIFISAHNDHTAKSDGKMGSWLHSWLGDAYYPIAIATADGNYTAREDLAKTSAYHAYPLQAPFMGAAEYYFQKSTIQDYILSLQVERTNKDISWLNQELPFRSLGAVLQKTQFSRSNLPNVFNALIFIRHTEHTDSFMLKK